jgi:DNA-binding CsgD family transcriptional regulator
LSQPQIAALLRFVRDLYVPRDREGFVSYLLREMPRLVPSDVVSFNEADPVARTSQTWLNPQPPSKPTVDRLWNELMHEHPFVAQLQRDAGARPVRLSELASPGPFARTALYNELLRPIGVDQQILMGLPSGHSPVRGTGLYRHRRDFSDRDKLLLTLLQPHLIQADHNADWVSRRLDELRMLERGVEQLERGLMVLGPGAAVRLATHRARQYLGAYFPGRRNGLERLPDALHRWVVEQVRSQQAPDVPPPPDHTLVVEGAGARLTVRLVADREGALLLLHEQRSDETARSLRALGLSRREAEVLTWVGEGKTNPEIAVILGLSARTVQTHLDRIFRKLGVATRTAAVAAALQADKAGSR